MFLFGFGKHGGSHAPPVQSQDDLLRWDPSFSVGNALIDNEHHEILNFLNRVYADWRASRHQLQMVPILVQLRRLMVMHFHNEEQVLRRHRCPHLAEHHHEHQKLLAELDRLGDLPEGTELEGQVTDFIRRVMLGHILNVDLEMADYMRE